MIHRKLLTPFEKFVKVESLSGILLFGSAIVALIWANSSLRDSYFEIWQYEIGISSTNFTLIKPLLLWINDGLMAIFFFLIGLEIKRELWIGELNSLKKATLPLMAAIGGMIFPLVVYLFLNVRPETQAGWAIPMATDIAFSLAIIKLLGDRIPLSLKIFLTAFAIVDDLGAVLIIAFFYSSGVKWPLLLTAMAILVFLFILYRQGYYIKYLTLASGAVIWYLFLKAGIHPTIAGVLLAFTIPIRQRMNIRDFLLRLKELDQGIAQAPAGQVVLSRAQLEQIARLEELTENVHSPLQHLENRLHGWVAYLIMPLFALANAGIFIGSDLALDYRLVLNIGIALVVGKGLGVVLMSVLGLKLRLVEMPEGMTIRQISGVGILAGVGFTMSIFIANLAFMGNAALVDSSKVGILLGSAVAGFLGYLILRKGN